MGSLRTWLQRIFRRGRPEHRPSFAWMFREFKEILANNNRILELIAAANERLSGEYVFDRHYIDTWCAEVLDLAGKLVFGLENLAPGRYPELLGVFQALAAAIDDERTGRRRQVSTRFIMDYAEISRTDLDEVGAKNAQLAVLANELGLRVPRGFAVTVAGAEAFLTQVGILDWDAGGRPALAAGLDSETIRRRIENGDVPPKLRRDLAEAVRRLTAGDPHRRLVCRSSAWGEDGVHSFAGQYESVVGVRGAEVERAYRRVVASLFSAAPRAYREARGYLPEEMGMAVGVQEMIDAQVSGVVYSRDPLAVQRPHLVVTATWGLGGPLVAGRVRGDRFVLHRRPPHRLVEMEVAHKAVQAVAGATGEEEVAVADGAASRPCLTEAQLQRLAEVALAIENFAKQLQDIEFCFSHQGELVILQARPLVMAAAGAVRPPDLTTLSARYPVLCRDQGEVAHGGVATGVVKVVDAATVEVPTGAILVARHATPALARLLPRAGGLITEVGAVAGHLGTVAREYRIPALFNCRDILSLVTDGMEVTLDADERVLYRGAVPELQLYYAIAEEPVEESAEYRLLRRLLRRIEPLHLVDPAARNFTAGACRTVHDITRFVHEKAVEALIDYHFAGGGNDAVSGVLRWQVPLDLTIIDIGGGLAPGARGRIKPADIRSRPMAAMVAGLSIPGAWDNRPVAVDAKSFMASLTRTMAPELATPKVLGRNLAVLSTEYANLSLRLGYHFTMVDAYVTERVKDNTIYFRFFGGVTTEERRGRRARLLSEILAGQDFRVEVHGDLVVARLKRLDQEAMLARLRLVGLLIGFTRQLDVLLDSEAQVEACKQQFFSLLEAEHERQDIHPHP